MDANFTIKNYENIKKIINYTHILYILIFDSN